MGKEEQHRRAKTRKSDIPIVGLDYAFPSFGSGVMLTVLIVTEIFSGAVESILVTEKGPTEYPVKSIVRLIHVWGIDKVTLWSDQEPAIKASFQQYQQPGQKGPATSRASDMIRKARVPSRTCVV